MSKKQSMNTLNTTRMLKSLSHSFGEAKGIHTSVYRENTDDPGGHKAVFLIQSGGRKIAVPLGVVAECIKTASDQSHIPPVPEDWWEEVINV